MMLVSKLAERILVCTEMDSHLLVPTSLDKRRILQKAGLCLYALNVSDDEAYRYLSGISTHQLRRYLDRFYLWIPVNDFTKRQMLIDEFFEVIAREYDLLIDRQRNLENIANLITFLKQFCVIEQDTLVLDYGSGTGLSMLVEQTRGIRIVGVERSQAMREIAASRGMNVWGPGTLARQARGSVDAAFASYVFHLLPNPGGLKLLSMRLKIGGVLVANFHKGEGVEFVTRHLTESGCSSRTVMPTVAENRHGVYVAYVKR